MASTMMNIPKVINVGYQKRGGTYTGKLAYVVYTDDKGKLRKEKSWTGWCDDKIKKDEFKNEPMEGFVLNKGVGGQRESYGWNARNEYIRVYDPRDFEFEISVANLLFILQECSSIKGKGLEGEFVYAWDRADLVLLPCCSQEYQECVKYTENQIAKVTKDQMVEGCTYQMRNMTNVMYLGRHTWFSKEHNWSGGTRYCLKPCDKRHIFLDLNSTKQVQNYVVEKGFTKIAKRISDEASPDYANAYEKMQNSVHCLIPTKIIFTKIKIKKEAYNENAFIKKDDEYYSACVCKKYYGGGDYEFKIANQPFVIPEIKSGSVDVGKSNILSYNDRTCTSDTKSFIQLQNMEFYKICLVNEKGASYDLM